MSPAWSESVSVIAGAVIALGWLAYFLPATLTLLRACVLEQRPVPCRAAWPALSVIIAARDQAHTLDATVRSLLTTDYPDLEVVVVDDRSLDGTQAVALALAASDERVKVVSVGELPAGCLGKVNALAQGTRAARGDLLLYTDADVLFAPRSLGRAVGLLLDDKLDHLAVCPHLLTSGRFAAAFTAILLASVVNKWARLGAGARVRAPIGMGAFNLVRRAALARTPGWAWLKMEVLDDVGLGVLLHCYGFTSGFAVSREEVGLAWYASLAEAQVGIEKNLYAALADYRPCKALGYLVQATAFALLPLSLLFAPRSLALWSLVAVALGSLGLYSVVAARRFAWPWRGLLLFPLGGLLICVALVRAGWLFHRAGGLSWRGTFYPKAALAEGHRVGLYGARSLLTSSSRDWGGFYFQILGELGEDISGRYAWVFGPGERPVWGRLTHSETDGLSAVFAVLEERFGPLSMAAGPVLTRPSPGTWRLALALLRAIQRRRAARRHPPLRWSWQAAGSAAEALGQTSLAYALFSSEETARLAKRARAAGVSQNSLLLWAVNQVLSREHGPSPATLVYLIPASLRGQLPGTPATFNQVGSLLVELEAGASPGETHGAVRERFRAGAHWAEWARAQLGGLLGETLFRRAVVAGHERLRAQGATVITFSNLGAWPQPEDLARPSIAEEGRFLVGTPPVISYSPLVFSALEWKRRLCVTLFAHQRIGLSTERATELLEAVKQAALQS